MGGIEMIVLDTHTWVWWVSNPDNLSVTAKNRINRSITDNTIFVSSISVWEVAMLVAKGRLKLALDIKDWLAKCEALPFLRFIPVNNGIAVKSAQLPGKIHSDPADRIIIATAIIHACTLITQDDKILNYPHVKTLW
jgi:PIN domain nuclease of toxin-antitoxin system